VNFRLVGVRAILLDIEGTTTPISFVHDILFPFARARLRPFLTAIVDTPALVDLSARLRREHDRDMAADHPPPPWDERSAESRVASIEAYSTWLMDRDRKSTPLKELQGWIWRDGYERGELQGVVFDDVREALEAWYASGLVNAIYSSGSVLAQRLLFAHTQSGDLTPFLEAFFDTTTGAKIDSGSYRRIATELAVPSDRIVFVSDATTELDAALSAGMQTVLCCRPGNPAQASGTGHPRISSFHELIVEAPEGS
jgi:2,3-diketo-5-methylthio-1-phosphopentane phosphatase